MLPRSKSSPSGTENFVNGMKPRKKPAPPRPPQPSHLKLQNSQSFRSASEIKSFNQSLSNSNTNSRPNQNSDLIDFSTTAIEPSTTNINRTAPHSIDEGFMYRVGASVFYIKSPLKNSSSENPSSHPFSPPRPSAEALLSTPTKKVDLLSNSSNISSYSYHSQSQTTTTTTSQLNPKSNNPTIIRAHGGSMNSNSSSSSGSVVTNVLTTKNNNNTINAWNTNTTTSRNTNTNSQQQLAQTRYSNVPLTWDEPPKKIAPAIAPKPTIIRPKPLLNAMTSVSSISSVSTHPQPVPVLPVEPPTTTPESKSTRNYYDEPPESEEDDNDNYDEFDASDSFASPPMPDEPPPPPPPEIEQLDEWVEGTTAAEAYYEDLPQAYTTEGVSPYAIALYDYVPEAEGDLAIQAGDLVYLTKRIDESWLYGMCSGVEGMFPATYVNIVVPLDPEEIQDPQINFPATEVETEAQVETAPLPESASDEKTKYYYADVLYQFKAETENDLSLEPGDVVTIWGRINDDWLYGVLNREHGQFPAAFVDPVPSDLPIINI